MGLVILTNQILNVVYSRRIPIKWRSLTECINQSRAFDRSSFPPREGYANLTKVLSQSKKRCSKSTKSLEGDRTCDHARNQPMFIRCIRCILVCSLCSGVKATHLSYLTNTHGLFICAKRQTYSNLLRFLWAFSVLLTINRYSINCVQRSL